MNRTNGRIRLHLKIQIKTYTLFLVCLLTSVHCFAQVVPITSHNINADGQVELTVNSSTAYYYQLQVRNDSSGPFELNCSFTLGNADSTIITEALSAYPIEHYQVTQHEVAAPGDIDGDSFDDLIEWANLPHKAPMNSATEISLNDGALHIDNISTFENLATTKDQVNWAEYLNERAYVKFAITDFSTNSPKIYFINSGTHNIHSDFLNAVGIDPFYQDMKKGEIIFHPNTTLNSNIEGAFTFNLSNGLSDDFEVIQRCHELLAAQIALIENNFAYLVTSNSELAYAQDLVKYQNSRIPILLEAELFEDFDYWALNPAEGFGYFRKIELGETPSPRDIVLYESLPNDITRVGGIITSQFQSPLSHVNLRAIQNKIPNSFIRAPLLIDSIRDLLDHYIYYRVENNNYIIRQSSLEEVNAWYERLRPKEEQFPPLNLDYTNILALDDIQFGMSDGFGAKCTNVATMRTFGFPIGTIPDGYGVPYYFYQEFMKYNGFFDDVEELLNNENFQSNRDVQELELKKLRDKIKDASMPSWMLDELTILQNAFPSGTSIRCRSSSNNEDLPSFSGAGLYTSKTQHPSEGHISKSIKQVFASMWNLRAFEEREFYKINHFVSSMGVLCHPNYSLEKANGVGVSFDPLYGSDNYFYLNSQVDENLITNPNANSIPEEILLNRDLKDGLEFRILRYSNQTSNDSLIMNQTYLSEMRSLLSTIHDEFYLLYDVKLGEEFAMDIEYKITKDYQLIIKQARPWIFSNEINITGFEQALNVYPNPNAGFLNVYCKECVLKQINIFDYNGKLVKQYKQENTRVFKDLDIQDLPSGIYLIQGVLEDNESTNTSKLLKF